MSEPAPPEKKSALVIVAIVLIVLALIAGCICCVGIGSMFAIPMAINRVREEKAQEATRNLRELSIRVRAACAAGPVADAGPVPVTPGAAVKQFGPFDADPGFQALGFRIQEPVYYSYAVRNEPGGTRVLSAMGDLDGDGQLSRYEVRCAAQCRCAPMTVVDALE